MTAIAAWVGTSNARETLWIASDSRTSSQGDVVMDVGAKIFALPVEARLLATQKAFFAEPYYRRNVGFAISGSSLIGLTTAALAGTLLINFTAQNIDAFPSMMKVAESVRDALYHVTRSYNMRGSNCEALLAGWCPLNQTYEIYRLSPQHSPHFSIAIHKAPRDRDAVLILGGTSTQQQDIRLEIERVRSGHETFDLSWERAPLRVIDSAIENQKYPSVGGHLQLGIDYGRGFHIFATDLKRLDHNGVYIKSIQGFEIPRIDIYDEPFISVIGMI